jgi:hypothetical protein
MGGGLEQGRFTTKARRRKNPKGTKQAGRRFCMLLNDAGFSDGVSFFKFIFESSGITRMAAQVRPRAVIC